MANRKRTAAVAMAAAAILAVSQASMAAESSTAALDVPADHGHVRSDSPAINAAIRDALDRSAAFRQLVATINASDSYVFVNEGKCGHGVRACFVNVRSAGLHRYLFVRIDSRKTDGELIGSIGHELRHTAAVEAGNAVRAEVSKLNRQAKSE